MVVASVSVNCGTSKKGRARVSEGKRLLAFLKRLEKQSNAKIVVADRRHTSACSLTSAAKPRHAPGGGDVGCAGRVALRSDDEEAQTADVKFKLAMRPDNDQGLLTLTFSPSRILTGDDAQPTLTSGKNGNEIVNPSSSRVVTDKMFELGFDLLESLARTNADTALFDPKVDAESIDIHRTHWDAFLPSPDPCRFLQVLPFMYGQTVSDDGGVLMLATLLGLTLKFETDPQARAVTSVTLEKRQGRKKLFSIKFSVRDADDGKRGVNNAPSGFGAGDVRVSITAHADGIATIIRAARKRLLKLVQSDRTFFGSQKIRFDDEETDRTGSQVADALWVLGHRQSGDCDARRSFADWLVPYVLNDVLRLNVLGSFTGDGLNRLVGLDDKVAIAWRETRTTSRGWAKELGQVAEVSDETIYERRRRWLAAYGIDILIPYQFYVDLLSLGSLSATEWKRRVAMIAAASRDDAKEVLAQLNGALDDFDRQRRGVVGKTIKAHVTEVDVVAIDSPITRVMRTRGRKALPPAAKKRRVPGPGTRNRGRLGHAGDVKVGGTRTVKGVRHDTKSTATERKRRGRRTGPKAGVTKTRR